jgi:hypothetical protein
MLAHSTAAIARIGRFCPDCAAAIDSLPVAPAIGWLLLNSVDSRPCGRCRDEITSSSDSAPWHLEAS